MYFFCTFNVPIFVRYFFCRFNVPIFVMLLGASPASRDRGGKCFSRFPEAFSGRNFNVFFRPKPGDLQKKKKLFLMEITNFNVFSGQKKQLLPKKYRGGQEINRGAKTKIGGALPPLPPRWRRAWMLLLFRLLACQFTRYSKRHTKVRKIIGTKMAN